MHREISMFTTNNRKGHQMRKHLAVALVLGLAACGTPGTPGTTAATDQAAAKTLITSCNGFATAERAIAVFVNNGQIKVEAFSTIDKARATARGLCDPNAPVPTDLVGAMQQVDAAAAALVAITPTGGK